MAGYDGHEDGYEGMIRDIGLTYDMGEEVACCPTKVGVNNNT